MNEQVVFLILLIAGLSATLYLYIWDAKKAAEYKDDERYQLIQNKANATANHSNSVLILLAVGGNIAATFFDWSPTFTLSRVLTLIALFICLRNAIELIALIYFNKQL
jgi:hypothetical protein